MHISNFSLFNVRIICQGQQLVHKPFILHGNVTKEHIIYALYFLCPLQFCIQMNTA